jgi:hypothetical protein
MQRRRGEFAAGCSIVQSLLPVIATLLLASDAIMPAQQSTSPYPIAIGNYWIYRGRVTLPIRETAPGRLLPSEPKEMTWRSEITKVAYRRSGVDVKGLLSPPIVAAVFDNFPLGLTAWYPGSEGPLGILIEVNSKRFYAITYTQAAVGKLGMQSAQSEISGILLRVQDSQDSLSDLLDDSTPILEMPLAPGKGWGPPFSHWSVTQREKKSLIGVRGARAAWSREGFILETSDNSGTVRFDFVPGIGITHVFCESLFPRGDPNHHELDVRLVEVHLNKTQAVVAR